MSWASRCRLPTSPSFTTVDLTPPTHLNLAPVAGTSGVPVTTTIRVTVLGADRPDEAERARSSRSPGLPVRSPGQIDYAFGNTVAIFTPTFPLAENAVYRVQAPPATDIAGNVQAQGLDYTFATTDRTPPQVLQLVRRPP